MLSSLAKLSAEGSSLVFDYAGEGLFTCDVKRVRNMVAMAAIGRKAGNSIDRIGRERSMTQAISSSYTLWNFTFMSRRNEKMTVE